MSLASDKRGAILLGMCIALPHSGSAMNYELGLMFSLMLSAMCYKATKLGISMGLSQSCAAPKQWRIWSI